MTISINNAGGNWSGDVAGGDVHKVQVQAMGDDVAKLLAGQYQDDPEVRRVIESSQPPAEKKRLLHSLLVRARGWSAEAAGTAIAKLMQGH